MGFATEWGNVWNKSIQPFTKAKRYNIPELEPVFSGTVGLIRSLEKMDRADPQQFTGPSKAKEKKKALSECNKEFSKGFKKEATKYAKLVDLAIKKTDKQAHKAVYRELKVIRTHLDWLESSIQNHLATHGKDIQQMNDKAGAAIAKKTDKLRKEGKTDNEIRHSTQFLKFAKLMVAFPTAAKTGAAKAVAAIQAIKADPTPSTYNTEMNKGGRNYTQQINNAIALAQHNDCPAALQKLLSGLIGYDAALKQFGGGNKRTVAANADKDAILALTKEYSQLVKATAGYVPIISKYISKNKKKLGMK